MLSTGEILTKYLKEKNITQINFAKLLNVTPQYVNGVLKDRKSPSKHFLAESIKLLKVEKEYVELIERYEVYRNKKLVEETNGDIKYMGKYTDFGFVSELSNKRIHIVDLKDIKVDSYFISVQTNTLLPYFVKGDYIFFEYSTTYLEEDIKKGIFLMENNGFKELISLEYVDHKYIVRYFNKTLEDRIYTKTQLAKMNINYKAVGRFSKIGEE